MTGVPPKPLCIYCGNPTKRGKRGEHIVQEALGGALTLNDVSTRVVCPQCNNGPLARVDDELSTRSFLAIVASQVLDANLYRAWDIDHGSEGLLVEARPSWAEDGELTALTSYPQLTFDGNRVHMRGDWEEAAGFGWDDFTKVLFRSAYRCFERYRAGVKGAIHFERIQPDSISAGCRLAPRIFRRSSIWEIARGIHKDQSFILRFVSEDDKRLALHRLSGLDRGPKINQSTRRLGSHQPRLCTYYNLGTAFRGLLKIGFNLVAAYCPNTPVNHRDFASVVRLILGKVHPGSDLIAANGFIHAVDVADIKGELGEHTFRLVHLDNAWNVYFSFFGGRIGAFVRFPGPNHEWWRTVDIVAPIRSKDWGVSYSPILKMLKANIAWSNTAKVIPSFKLQHSESAIQVEYTRRGRRQESKAG